MTTEGNIGLIKKGDTVEVVIGHQMIVDGAIVETKPGHIGKQAIVEEEFGNQYFIRFNDGSNIGCWKQGSWLKLIKE